VLRAAQVAKTRLHLDSHGKVIAVPVRIHLESHPSDWGTLSGRLLDSCQLCAAAAATVSGSTSSLPRTWVMSVVVPSRNP
jgi:hypothetical protein